MMYDKILPLAPIRLPTLVNSILSSMNPSATSAKPLYAFRTVTSTGMSAPPIAADVVHPFANDRTVFAARQVAAMAGAVGAMVRNTPIVAMLVASMPELMRCRPGRTVGREDIRPASFINARMEPGLSETLNGASRGGTKRTGEGDPADQDP